MITGEVRRLVLEGERPVSWNTYYSGKHWSARNKEAQRVHQLIRAELDPELEPFDGAVEIEFTVYGKSMDCDNVCTKLYIDGLKGWWLTDDTPEYVSQVTSKVIVSPMPRLEIVVTQTGKPFAYACVCCGRKWPTKKTLRAHEKEMRD